MANSITKGARDINKLENRATLSANVVERLTRERRYLHQHPELSGCEYATADRIETYLSQHTTAKTKRVAQTGVLATFESQKPGPKILIRVDTDALPIQETNDFDYRSEKRGVSHKCGHDGHTAIGLGLAELLTKAEITSGKVDIIFQPSEENGCGAKAVWADPNFHGGSYNFAFALHNLPRFEIGAAVVREGAFTAQVQSMIVKLTGKTSHAAEPEHGVNPALEMAAILAFSERLSLNEPTSPDFFVIVPVYANLGEKAYGISAGEGELHFTMRSWNTELLRQKTADLVAFISRRAEEADLKFSIEFLQEFDANFNSSPAVSFIRKAIVKSGVESTEAKYPFKWGEDFGYFTQRIRGAMFGLGAGLETPALHNPEYDFPDELIPIGAALFYEIIQEAIKP